VRWAVTEAGKSIPLDTIPADDGNLVLVHPSLAAGPTVRYLRASEPAPEGRPRYRSHFASCPQSGEWRKPKAAS
jgi:hypothetical protein